MNAYVNGEKSIRGFTTNETRWLSNYWPCLVVYDGLDYKNSESAYQSAKTLNREDRVRFQTMGAGTSKKEGQTVAMREDWDKVKDNIMYEIVKDKFCRNIELAVKLMATEDKYLEETNWWNDIYWGVCRGIGENKLGHILMRVREEIKQELC